MEGPTDVKRVLTVAKDEVLVELELRWKYIIDALEF
jgi:hypothetical protein